MTTTGGCYGVLGPFYFGRAYEHPPHFTWSMTASTGQTVVGSKCVNRVFMSVPSLEQVVAERGLGPGGNELPVLSGSDVRFSDGSSAGTAVCYAKTSTNSVLTVETSSPPPGATHYIRQPSLPSFGGQFMIFNDFTCEFLGSEGWYISLVSPGDTYTIRYYARASSTSNSPTVRFGPSYFNAATGALVSSPIFSLPITSTSWTQYEATRTIPNGATAFLLRVDYQAALFNMSIDIGRIDMTINSTATVESSAITEETGNFDLNVSFEGNHLKGYAGTHPIPHRSGPETLKLTCLGQEDL